MHRLLKRQLIKAGLAENQAPEDLEAWKSFLKSVENVYVQAEEDRYLLERSLEISSLEMKEEIDRNKQMSLQLAQASKLASLGTLASGVAHELNNPLAGIKGYAEMMIEDENLNEEDMDCANSIVKLCNRMAGIIKHMLKLSRQSENEEVSSIDIRDQIEDIKKLTAQQFETDQINVQIDLQAENYLVNASSNAIWSLLQNLFCNSRDAFFEKRLVSERRIHLRVSNNDKKDQVYIVYKDNAGGMPPDVVERIFDPFFTTKKVGEGTGLGLAISRQVIEDIGGSIKVESEEGRGTCFEITLPVGSEDNIEKEAS